MNDRLRSEEKRQGGLQLISPSGGRETVVYNMTGEKEDRGDKENKVRVWERLGKSSPSTIVV